MNAARKTPSPSATTDATPEADLRRQRADGAEARQRLLDTALRLFAQQGFSKTSTRDIAQTAEVNIASIKYYFGDKAGLYRAAFAESMGPDCGSWVERCNVFELSLHDALKVFYTDFLAPLKQSETTQLGILLHFREVLEPTGMWQEEIDKRIKPAHADLVQLLLQHMQVEKEDDEIHRLAFAIAGLAFQIYINHDIMRAIRPSLIASGDELERWTTQLTTYAEAMVVNAAMQRRAHDSKKSGHS